MVMEDIDSRAQNEAATAPPPADPGMQRSDLTNAELRTMIASIVTEANTALQQSVDRRVGRLEQLQNPIRELLENTRKMEAFQRRLLSGTVSEEEIQAVEAELAQQKAETDRKTLEERLSAAEKALSEQSGLTQKDRWDGALQRANAYAVNQGFASAEEAWALFTDETKRDLNTYDPKDTHFIGWEQRMRQRIDEQADKRHKATTPRPAVPSARGAGAPELSSLDRIKRGLAARQVK